MDAVVCADAHETPAPDEQRERRSRRLLLVHLSSQRTLVPVRQDGCFAEKQEPHPALLLIVRRERLARGHGDARRQAESKSAPDAAARERVPSTDARLISRER
jgi:hypothetical protein